MISITTTIFKDSARKEPYNPEHEIQITDDLKKARIINPWKGAWGMDKRSGYNNLNTIVSISGGKEEAYAIYSLRAMGQKCFFKINDSQLKK